MSVCQIECPPSHPNPTVSCCASNMSQSMMLTLIQVVVMKERICTPAATPFTNSHELSWREFNLKWTKSIYFENVAPVNPNGKGRTARIQAGCHKFVWSILLRMSHNVLRAGKGWMWWRTSGQADMTIGQVPPLVNWLPWTVQDLESLSQPLVMSSSSQDLLDSASSTVSTASATITSSTVDLLTSDNLADDPGDQSSDVGGVHPHLVAVQPNIEGLNADTLQVNSEE